APRPSQTAAASATPAPPRSRPSPGEPAGVVPAIGGDPAHLARQLTTAETMLGGRDASPALMAPQAPIVQLVRPPLTARPGGGGPVLGQVPSAQRASAAADIAATADLVALTPSESRLPPWRIVPAASMATLRADYRAAQAATGVGWSYLAAINFVETDF